jgi:hypothetical protein
MSKNVMTNWQYMNCTRGKWCSWVEGNCNWFLHCSRLQSTGLKRKFKGHHMMNISHCLKFGGGKLHRLGFWNVVFLLDEREAQRVG